MDVVDLNDGTCVIRLEDSVDLLKVRFLLHNAELLVSKRIRNDRYDVVKRKKEIINVSYTLKNLYATVENRRLKVKGMSDKGQKTEVYNVGCELKIRTNYDSIQNEFAKKQRSKKVFYFGVDSNVAIAGYLIDGKFKQISKSYFIFKNVDYYEYVHDVVRTYSTLYSQCQTRVFKCLAVFQKQLTERTKLNWDCIVNDAVYDWKLYRPYQETYKKILKDYFHNRNVYVRRPDQVFQTLNENNVERIYVTENVSDHTLNLLRFIPGKLEYVLTDPCINFLIVNGLIIRKYF